MLNHTNYTPKTLDDFVFGNAKTKAILQGIVNHQIAFPEGGTTGILLYGVAGTGKTTLAKLLPDLIEASYGGEGAEDKFISCEQGVRGDLIMQQVRSHSELVHITYSGLAFTVLDEVDNLTVAAQKSLKAVMNAKQMGFILTTNYITKVDGAIKDRCFVLEMNAPTPSAFLPLLRGMACDVGWHSASDEDLVNIATAARGSYRDMSRQVQQASLLQETALIT